MSNPDRKPQDGPGVEQTERPEKQAPGYNETSRTGGDRTGDTDQKEPSWRPNDATEAPVNGGMQSEGEPGRAERDSTGGVEGIPDGE